MRTLKYILILLTFCSCSSQERYFKVNPKCEEINSLQKEKTFMFFDSEGKEKSKIYDLGPSKKLKENLLRDANFVDQIKHEYNFLLINQNCENGRNLANEYEIKTFPTIILTDNSGTEKRRLTGYAINSFIESRLFKREIEEGKTSITHSITHPIGTVDLMDLPIEIDDFWKVIEGEINFADKNLNKGKFLNFSPFGFQWGDDNYTIKAYQHAEVVQNQSSGNNLSIDVYIDTLNQITFRKIVYRDIDRTLQKNLNFEEKTFDLKIFNKNEIEISNPLSNVKMVRDTLREWKN